MARHDVVLEACHDETLAELDGMFEPRAEPAHQAVRLEMICRIRKLIESGRYDTDERLQAALDRLLESMM